jgi:3-oxoacyl-[acyl-carrier protein] reductase
VLQVILIHSSLQSTQLAQDIVDKITSLPHHPQALSIRGDLRQPQTPGSIVETAKRWLSTNGKDEKIHILVNNAGVELVKRLGDITPEDFSSVYDVNVRGTLFMTQAVLPCLAEKGRIINIASVGARAGFPGLSIYGSSKAAMEGLTRSWAAELGYNGTTVNTVNPGPVQSEMLDNIPKDIVEAQKKATPVQNRVGTVEEVADVVGWLAGEESRWITGQTISASGGWAMY